MNKNIKNVWLYSANYDNGWWLYDQKSTIKLNRIWRDYTIRNNFVKENDQFSMNIDTTSKSKYVNKIFQISCDHVSYDDRIDMNDDSSSSSIIALDDDIVLSYIIDVNDDKYYIDLDRMKQINCSNTSKQRTIKRIEIPKILEKNVVEYIINEHKINIKN